MMDRFDKSESACGATSYAIILTDSADDRAGVRNGPRSKRQNLLKKARSKGLLHRSSHPARDACNLDTASIVIIPGVEWRRRVRQTGVRVCTHGLGFLIGSA